MFLVVLSFRIVEHRLKRFQNSLTINYNPSWNKEIHIKATGNFLEKLRATGEIPKGAILVIADVVGLYPSVPNDECLKVLRNQYDKFIDKTVPTEDIIKMAEFILKNNLFEFNSKFYKQISGTAIGTKFAPPYACIFMDYIETEFLKSQKIKTWPWKRFIDDIFFIWADIDGWSYLHYDSCHAEQLSSVKHFDWKEYVLRKEI